MPDNDYMTSTQRSYDRGVLRGVLAQTDRFPFTPLIRDALTRFMYDGELPEQTPLGPFDDLPDNWAENVEHYTRGSLKPQEHNHG